MRINVNGFHHLVKGSKVTPLLLVLRDETFDATGKRLGELPFTSFPCAHGVEGVVVVGAAGDSI